MTVEDDVDTYVSPCEFAGRISCYRGSGSSGFPAIIIAGGKDDGDAPEVVVALSAIVSEDVITVDDFVEGISLQPSLLDEVDFEAPGCHQVNEMLIACVVVGHGGDKVTVRVSGKAAKSMGILGGKCVDIKEAGWG